jgi:hypothetical protein
MPSASAQETLAARARRIATLRRRVVAATLATFVLAWGVVAFDGSMGAETSVASTSATTATDTETPPADDGSVLTTQQS